MPDAKRKRVDSSGVAMDVQTEGYAEIAAADVAGAAGAALEPVAQQIATEIAKTEANLTALVEANVQPELQAKLQRQLIFLQQLQSHNFGGGGKGFVGGGSQQKGADNKKADGSDFQRSMLFTRLDQTLAQLEAMARLLSRGPTQHALWQHVNRNQAGGYESTSAALTLGGTDIEPLLKELQSAETLATWQKSYVTSEGAQADLQRYIHATSSAM